MSNQTLNGIVRHFHKLIWRVWIGYVGVAITRWCHSINISVFVCTRLWSIMINIQIIEILDETTGLCNSYSFWEPIPIHDDRMCAIISLVLIPSLPKAMIDCWDWKEELGSRVDQVFISSNCCKKSSSCFLFSSNCKSSCCSAGDKPTTKILR